MAVPHRLGFGSSATASVGGVLREEREKQKLSLEQLSKQTRISASCLQAIEADDLARMSPFYYRSFVKQMSAALKLEYTKLETAVKAASASTPETPPPVQMNYVPKLAPIRPRNDSAWGWASILFSLFAVMAVCSGVYAFLDRIQLSDLSPIQQASSTAAGSQTKQSVPAARERLKIAKPLSSEAISLKIAAVEKSWLAVETDGKPIYSGLLEAEATKELEGRESAKIRTGNAGGLTVTFNGRQLGLLGGRGQVRTVLFTRDQYEILQPSLTTRLALSPGVILGYWEP